jgi:DNA-binding NarL/FixJ family response regulator
MSLTLPSTIRTMIADDHPMFAEGLATILKEQDAVAYDVAAIVNRGDKVIQMLRRTKPQLLLMDMNMPGQDGLEVLQEVSKGHFRDLKIIILTMYNDSKLAKEVLQSGASGYILKSSDSLTILNAIEEVLDDRTYVSDEVGLNGVAMPKTEEKTRFEDKFFSKRSLTKREVEVLRLIAQAKSNKEIGSELYISDQTVTVHRKNLMRKLSCNNAASLMKVAYEVGLIS